MRKIAHKLLISLLLLLSACSMSKDTSVAEAEVPHFHSSLDAGKFDEIYDAAADELKTAATKQDFVILLSAIHRKLGQVAKSEKQTWHVDYNTAGNFVTLVYNTTFTNGTGAEQFVYKLHDGQASLVGYHINSNALLIN